MANNIVANCNYVFICGMAKGQCDKILHIGACHHGVKRKKDTARPKGLENIP